MSGQQLKPITGHQLSLIKQTEEDEQKWLKYLDEAAQEINGIGATWTEIVAYYSENSLIRKEVVERAFELLIEDDNLSESEKMDGIENLSDTVENDQDTEDFNDSFISRNYAKEYVSPVGSTVIKQFVLPLTNFNIHVTSEKQGYLTTSHSLRCIDKETGQNITDAIQEIVKVTPKPVGVGTDKKYVLSSMNLCRVIGFIKNLNP